MAYVPDWERLSEALNRVMAAGVSEDEAKLDISCAIADEKIRIRVTIAEGTCDIAATLTGANVKAPPHLVPDDFDWTNSRPVKPWPTGPRDWKSNERHSFSWQNRPISLIEIHTADVIAWVETILTKATCELTSLPSGAERADDSLDGLGIKLDGEQSAAPVGHEVTRAAATLKPRRGAKTRGIVEAVNQLWPNEIPKGLSPKERDNAIIDQMKRDGSSIPSVRTIQRVLKAQRTK